MPPLLFQHAAISYITYACSLVSAYLPIFYVCVCVCENLPGLPISFYDTNSSMSNSLAHPGRAQRKQSEAIPRASIKELLFVYLNNETDEIGKTA